MPAVKITKITFFQTNPDTNSLAFQVYYKLANAGIDDLLEFTI